MNSALSKLGEQVIFLDQEEIMDIKMDYEAGPKIEGKLEIHNRIIDLESITGAYLRPYDSRQLPDVEHAGQGSRLWDHALAIEEAIFSWAELTSALVINRPASMTSNSSKPYQALMISRAGFKVPDTLITSDPEAVIKFWNRHGSIIYKSISGVRSIVSRFTQAHLERLENVRWCPTQFQQYIPGEDYRVHVIGNELFACKIISKADDYRYAAQQNHDVKIEPCQLPKEVSRICKELVNGMGLVIAGIDLRRTSENEWYCFEANPSPGFTYYQQETGQPIDEAVANLLIGSREKG